MQRKSTPEQVKELYSISKWLLVGIHPANRICLECPRGRMTVYREKKKKEKGSGLLSGSGHRSRTKVKNPQV